MSLFTSKSQLRQKMMIHICHFFVESLLPASVSEMNVRFKKVMARIARESLTESIKDTPSQATGPRPPARLQMESQEKNLVFVAKYRAATITHTHENERACCASRTRTCPQGDHPDSGKWKGVRFSERHEQSMILTTFAAAVTARTPPPPSRRQRGRRDAVGRGKKGWTNRGRGLG